MVSRFSVSKALVSHMDDDMDDEIEVPQPFVDLLEHENMHTDVKDDNVDPADEKDDKVDPAASIINPNINDSRRLFQEHRVPEIGWDCNIPLEQQPNLLDLYGPKPLQLPDH